MKIWVTRTQPGAAATAERLSALGHEPIVAPLLDVRRLDAPIDLTGIAAIALTSANAAEGLSGGDIPVFAVGEATAHAALRAGFSDVQSASGDVYALGQRIAASLPPGAMVLHPCAAERAGDLEAPLANAGLKLRLLPVYETLAAPVDAAILRALAGADAVLLHSPKAARILTALLQSHPSTLDRAFCLSQAVADALRGIKIANVAVATLSNDTALLNLVSHDPRA